MKPVHCAAVDLGATSGRVIVGSWANGHLNCTEVHRFPVAFHTLGTHDYWDLPGIWSEVRRGLIKARTEFPDLVSVGVDTWGVDYVLTNEAGRLVYPAHAYRDARTQPGLQRLAHTRAALGRVYAATGVPNVFYNTSLQLEETIASCPAITDLAARCLFLPDYFNFLLSGRMENELSVASTSQLLDVHGNDWSRATLDHFRVPAQWLTKPIKAGANLGRVKNFPELAGVKVIAVPGHDTACAFEAMPGDKDGGALYISAGTWSLVGFESASPVLGDEALAHRISNERMGDGRYRPLTNVVGLWLLEQTMKDFGTKPKNALEWKKLIAAAEKLPGAKNPAALLDVSQPELLNPTSMRSAIDQQLKQRKVRPPQDLPGYVRLICESIGSAHARAMERFERLTGKKFESIIMVGGGSKNRLLCQATADAAGIPVHALNLEGAAVGNLGTQLIAIGAVRNREALREAVAADGEMKVYRARTSDLHRSFQNR